MTQINEVFPDLTPFVSDDPEFRKELMVAVKSVDMLRTKIDTICDPADDTSASSRSHLWYMCNKIQEMCASAKTVSDICKISRWLGFMHGVLVTRNVVSLDELRNSVKEFSESFRNVES